MEFRVLGPVEMLSGGRSVVVRRRRERCLLGLLLLEVGQPVPVDRLVDLLWDDHPPTDVRAALSTYVSRLRAALARAATGTEPPARLVRVGTGYAIEADPMSVDSHRFEHLVSRARGTTDHAVRARLLREALSLWRGPPMADAASDSLRDRVCAALIQMREAAVRLRIEADLAIGRHQELVGELAELAAESPMDEQVAAYRMKALYRAGRRQQALEVFGRIRRLLADELGLDPGAELTRLERAVLSGDPLLDLPGGTEPGGPVSRPAQLPADVADFTGRGEYLVQLDDLHTRICLIVGTAGIGKTALAVHWAHRVADRFPDGQLYVDLRGYARERLMRPIEALAGFLRALGVPGEQVPTEESEAASLYRSRLSGKRVLIIADNAGSAGQVRALLPGAGGCLVVVTSRNRLTGLVARDGARRLSLDVLTEDEAVTLIADIVGRHRVAAEPDAAVGLARACGYLPLAVRIAAANLADQPSGTIADHAAAMRDRGRLAALNVDGDESFGVAAAFDCSCMALTAEARRLFRLLGLVPGPDVTAEAAAALAACEPAETAVLLDRLAAVHLVEQRVTGRFSMHDLLREYARQRVDAEEPADVRDAATGRLYDFYLQHTRAAAHKLYPVMLISPYADESQVAFDSPVTALGWLDAELPNLVAAATSAAADGFGATSWLLAFALRGYFWTRGDVVDWLMMDRAALDAAASAGDLAGQAIAHLCLGQAFDRQSQHERAVGYLRRASELAERASWPHGHAMAVGTLGGVYLTLGRLPEAAEQHRRSLRVKRDIGWQAGLASDLNNLANVCRMLGRLREAADHCQEALALHRHVGSLTGEATTLCNIAITYRVLGRLDVTRELLAEANAINQRIGNLHGVATVHYVLAEVHRDLNRLDQALDDGLAALTYWQRVGDRTDEAWALNTLGTVHLRLGQFRDAGNHHARALDIAHDTGDRLGIGEALVGLAQAQIRLGRFEDARDQVQQALVMAREHHYRLIEGDALTVTAELHLSTGDREQAAELAGQALGIHRETGYRLAEARAEVVLGNALLALDGRSAAVPHWRAALAIFTEVGTREADEIRDLVQAG